MMGGVPIRFTLKLYLGCRPYSVMLVPNLLLSSFLYRVVNTPHSPYFARANIGGDHCRVRLKDARGLCVHHNAHQRLRETLAIGLIQEAVTGLEYVVVNCPLRYLIRVGRLS